MARTPDLKKRRALALQAFDIIRARGPHRVSMSEIAGAIGVKRPTLYFHFKGLDEILEEVLTDSLERDRSLVAARVAAQTHPIDRLRAVLEGSLAFYESQDSFFVTMIQFWSSADPGRVVAKLERTFEPTRRAVTAMLEKGVTDGLIAPCDAAALFELTAALANGLLMHRVLGGRDITPLIRFFRQHLLEPLKREPTPTQETPHGTP